VWANSVVAAAHGCGVALIVVTRSSGRVFGEQCKLRASRVAAHGYGSIACTNAPTGPDFGHVGAWLPHACEPPPCCCGPGEAHPLWPCGGGWQDTTLRHSEAVLHLLRCIPAPLEPCIRHPASSEQCSGRGCRGNHPQPTLAQPNCQAWCRPSLSGTPVHPPAPPCDRTLVWLQGLTRVRVGDGEGMLAAGTQ
jgi:hypothetical protein